MKKPEKKTVRDILQGRMVGKATYVWARGYNQACDDWEKFLPSEEEIRDVISKRVEYNYSPNKKDSDCYMIGSPEQLAKAICQRIHKGIKV